MVDRANHDGRVDVAAQERDEHFHPDAMNELKTTSSAGPCRRSADPARRMLVGGPCVVPMEADLDATEIVDVNFLTRRPNDRRRIDHLNGAARRCFGSVRHAIGNAGEAVLVEDFATTRSFGSNALVLDTNDVMNTIV